VNILLPLLDGAHFPPGQPFLPRSAGLLCEELARPR